MFRVSPRGGRGRSEDLNFLDTGCRLMAAFGDARVAMAGKSEVKSWEQGVMDPQHQPPQWYYFHSPHFTDKGTGVNRYTGLHNHGSTCYLNSFLQAFFFLPCFRRAVFMWSSQEHDNADADAEEFSICAQFQRLFCFMQNSDIGAVPTVALTRSFGWGEAELQQQHDVQELYQILFQAMRRESGAIADNIAQDFTGALCSVVECLTCHSRRQTQREEFIDLSLAVRGCASVTEAYARFAEAEEMRGDNAVLCDECGTKQPCSKGIQLLQLPAVLVLHLQRFEMNWTTMQRSKISSSIAVSASLSLGYDAGQRRSGSTESEEKEKEPTCPYNLAAVLMHDGQAEAGHYFAYVRDPYRKQWAKFDDTTVTVLSDATAQAIFALQDTPDVDHARFPLVASNAYMLLYRAGTIQAEAEVYPDLPARRQQEVVRANSAYSVHKLQHDRLRQRVTIVLHYQESTKTLQLSDTTAAGAPTRLEEVASAALSWAQVCRRARARGVEEKEEVQQQLKEDLFGTLPMGEVRLRHVDVSKGNNGSSGTPGAPVLTDILSTTTLSAEEALATCTLRDLHLTPFQSVHMAVELRSDYVNGSFPAYDPNQLSLRLNILRSQWQQYCPAAAAQHPFFTKVSSKSPFLPPQSVSVSPKAVVADLRRAVADLLTLPAKCVGLLLSTDAGVQVFADQTCALRSGLRLVNGDTVLVELCSDWTALTEDNSATAQLSLNEVNSIALTVSYDKTQWKPAGELEVSVDIREPLGTLRELVVAKLGVERNAFKLLRAKGDRELKGAAHPLGYFGLVPGTGKGRRGSVHVEWGTPLDEDECVFEVFVDTETSQGLAADTKEVETSERKTTERYARVGEFVLRGTWSVERVKTHLHMLVSGESKWSCPPVPLMRLRRKRGARLMSAVRDDLSLQQNFPAWRDGTQLVLQQTRLPEHVGPDTLFLTVHEWCQGQAESESFVLLPGVEVGIASTCSVRELKLLLASLSGICPGPNHLRISKVSPPTVAALSSEKSRARAVTRLSWDTLVWTDAAISPVPESAAPASALAAPAPATQAQTEAESEAVKPKRSAKPKVRGTRRPALRTQRGRVELSLASAVGQAPLNLKSGDALVFTDGQRLASASSAVASSSPVDAPVQRRVRREAGLNIR